MPKTYYKLLFKVSPALLTPDLSMRPDLAQWIRENMGKRFSIYINPIFGAKTAGKEYPVGEWVKADPHTLGLFCFKWHDSAISFASGFRMREINHSCAIVPCHIRGYRPRFWLPNLSAPGVEHATNYHRNWLFTRGRRVPEGTVCASEIKCLE